MLPVETPFKTFTGLDGNPLNNGYVYFGLPNQNPITAPVTVYWDAAGTQPATDLRTINGYIVRAGTPANVFVSGSYSELVRDSSGRQVFYARNSDDFSYNTLLASSAGAAQIGFQPGGSVAADNVQDAIAEVASEASTFANSITATTGASVVGYVELAPDAVSTNLQSRVRELSAGEPTSIIPNLGTVTNRNCTILGDSISQGAFALNTFLHGWARIFARCFNAELGASSYGFVNFLSLGAGATATSDIHGVNFFGTAWGSVDSSTDANAADYPAGMAMRAGDATSVISIVVPSFQSRAWVYYGTRAGSANFTISVNGALAATVVTNAAAGWSFQEVAMADNGYGDNTIAIQSTAGAVQPDIIGISYLAAAVEPVVNNFSNSGRRLRYLGQNLIIAMMQESASMIVALGHNDQGDADADDAYYTAFMQRITWLTTYAKQYGVRLIVPDFCWSAAKSSRTRLALRQLAADTGGIYIDLPGELFKNRESIAPGADRYNYLINTYRMWVDGSHPNKYGHQWIAETIAKRIGLSCSSKNEALSRYDWWMPLALKVATGVYNYFTAPNSVSSYRRNGTEVVVRLFLHQSPALAFPVGTYQLQDTWRAISELSVYQGYAGQAVLRNDTGAVVSTIFAAASGSFSLKVLDGTWVNYQDCTLSMPAA